MSPKKKKSKPKSAKKIKEMVLFPMKVLNPVRLFLTREEKRLLKRKKELAKEDPFSDVGRVTDSAAPDTDAAEQEGHERVSALRQEIDKKLIQIKKALSRIRLGKYGICEKCGRMIDTDRLMIMPETTLCIDCGRKKEI